MLGDISGVENIYLVCGYTDMRKSIDGLCAVVEEVVKYYPVKDKDGNVERGADGRIQKKPKKQMSKAEKAQTNSTFPMTHKKRPAGRFFPTANC